MANERWRLLTIAFVSCSLTGCGLGVPDLKEAWDQDYLGDEATNTPPIAGAGQIEFEIKKHVWCELKDAVQAANSFAVIEKTNGKTVGDPNRVIPNNWAAEVTLNLEVDESSALNPGVSLNTPIQNGITNFTHEFIGTGTAVQNTAATTMIAPFVSTPQSYAFGLGGTLSSTATRTDKFDSHWSIGHLMKPITNEGVCNTDHPENDPFVGIGVAPAKSSPLIVSNLGLKQWLIGAMFTNKILPSDAPPHYTPDEIRAQLQAQGYKPAEIVQALGTKAAVASGAGTGGASAPKPDTVSIEIKFIIISNGNVTPTWKLVRVSANTGQSPLFATGRTRSHDLIVTIGPDTPATASTHQASLIGYAVSSGNRASVPTQ